jgi:hypothetical protein
VSDPTSDVLVPKMPSSNLECQLQSQVVTHLLLTGYKSRFSLLSPGIQFFLLGFARVDRQQPERGRSSGQKRKGKNIIILNFPTSLVSIKIK